MPEMYSIRKTAKILGITTYTVRNWAKCQKIKAVKIPDNSQHSQWFIPADEIKRLKGDTGNEEIQNKA